MAAIQDARCTPGGSCQSYFLAAAEPPRLGGKESGAVASTGHAPAKIKKTKVETPNTRSGSRWPVLAVEPWKRFPARMWLPVGPESLQLETRRFKTAIKGNLFPGTNAPKFSFFADR
jgi:hypothetical protein